MSQIKCPNCGTVFQVDESHYHEILQQVRNEEFEKKEKRIQTRFFSLNLKKNMKLN